MVFFKLILAFVALAFVLGAISAIFAFVVDVFKWHDPEKRVIVAPSKSLDNIEESEVITNADESDECDTPTLPELGD